MPLAKPRAVPGDRTPRVHLPGCAAGRSDGLGPCGRAADLLDLKATEAADLIERAYAADCVEIGINGNWNIVREELSVPGLGLVPEELTSQKWGWVREVDDDSDDDFTHDGDYVPASEVAAPIQSSGKIGRNEPCPCGSGKKCKKCCGR